MLRLIIDLGSLGSPKRPPRTFNKDRRKGAHVDGLCCSMGRSSRELRFDMKSSILLISSKSYGRAKVARFFGRHAAFKQARSRWRECTHECYSTFYYAGRLVESVGNMYGSLRLGRVSSVP